MIPLKISETLSFRIFWGLLIGTIIIVSFISIWSDRKSQGLEAFGFEFKDNVFSAVEEIGLLPDKTNLSIKIKNAVSVEGEHYLNTTFSIYIAGEQANQIIQSIGKKNCDKLKLKLTLFSGHKNYGPSVRKFECCTGVTTVSCNYDGKLKIFPISGAVVNYPLDKYIFKIPFLTEPKLSFNTVKIFNQTQNEIIEDTLMLETVGSKLYDNLKKEFSGSHFINNPPQLFLSFKMVRGGSLLIAYYTVLAYLIFFLYLFIFKIKTMGGLLSSVTGFFFSVWSLRQILDPKDEIPMDLLDTTVIGFAVLILIIIFTKLVFNKYKKIEKNNNS